MEDDKLYVQLAQMWQHYASWREKIFAGYLTVLAGLGVLFSQNARPSIRAMAFVGSILVSIVFVILDLRNEQFINVCQDAAAALEGKNGGYSTLNLLRDRVESRAGLGVAVRLLAGGVISGSIGGFCVYVIRWWQTDLDGTAVLGGLVVVITACLLPRFFRWLGSRGPRTSPHKAARLLGDSTPQDR